jgi:hypothetical protein
MPLPLIATAGAANANSYATVDDLDGYAETRVPAPTWFASATDDQKESALVMAARLLDTRVVWTGAAADSTQALVWPRNGMLNRNGFAIANTAIPADLKNAQCELALQLGASDLLADNEVFKQGITSVKAGSVAVTFKEISESTVESADIMIRKMSSALQWTTLPVTVRQFLVPSWYVQESVKRPAIFKARGPC